MYRCASALNPKFKLLRRTETQTSRLKTGVDELPSNATDAGEPSHPPLIRTRPCLVSFMRGTRDAVHVTDATACVDEFHAQPECEPMVLEEQRTRVYWVGSRNEGMARPGLAN